MWVLKVIFVVLLFVSIPTLSYSTKGNTPKKSNKVDVCSLWSDDWENTIEFKNLIFNNVKPFGGPNAGKYSKIKVNSWNECVEQCCQFDRCNVAYWISSTCLHIECLSDEMCQPIPGEDNSDINDETFFLQTRSVLSTAAALDFDDPGQDECNETRSCPPNEHCEKVSIHAQMRRNICLCDKEKQFRRINGICRQYLSNTKPCTLYDDEASSSCEKNQECLPPNDRAKHGYCQCKLGFRRRVDDDGCIVDSTSGTHKISTTSSSTSVSELEVQAGEDQIVQLPTDQIELNGRVVFRSNKTEVKLSDLNAKKLTSTWTIKSAPKDDQIEFDEQSIPQHVRVKHLREGIYEFELKLMDQHLTIIASDTIKIEVLQVKTTTTPPPLQLQVDSPMFVHLPQQMIGIKARVTPDNRRVIFQWTYAKDGPVTPTLENVDTAQLSVSNLRPGNYSFHLRAIDNLGNEQIQNVILIVDGEPIQARVARLREAVFWPMNDVVLDGTASIIEPHTTIRWALLSNDNHQKVTDLEISSPHSLKTMVTNLRIGKYIFQLSLTTNDRQYTSTTDILVTVYAENGQPPQIRIHSETNNINILDNLLILNASATTADYGIAKWQWIKSPLSPAAGRFLNNSNFLPIAYVTHLIEGQYVFTLRVTDDRQQMTQMDVNVTVAGIPHAGNLFEVIFDTPSSPLREGTLDTLLNQLRVFLVDLSPNINLTLIGFVNDKNMLLIQVQLAADDGRIVSPKLIADRLQNKIKPLSSASGVNIVSINSYLCFSNCSHRGQCDRETKRCICHRSYMENWFKSIVYHETNCDFVVHYVVLISIVASIFTGIFCWLVLCGCLRLKRRRAVLARRKRIRYQLLHDEDDDLESPNGSKKSKSKGKFRSGQKKKNRTMSDDSDDGAEEILYDKPLLTAKLQMNSPSSLRVPVQDSNGSPMVRQRTSDQSPTTTDHSVA